ncbi:MAG: ribosome assembly cofactor RimP [Bacteroidales bacterium]|jgi:ribosome maturation factor RimP|nr:ribosome assembly cofactor RimP [Bacteroidales bacterium]
MIIKQYIEELIREVIGNFDEAFIVDISVSSSNNIKVVLDSNKTFSISDCIELSQYLESKLDRDDEDFALEVSSAGLTETFKVVEQYHKNIGKDVEVITKDGKKFTAVLLSVFDNGIELEQEKKVKIEGKKRKEIVKEKFLLDFDNIKSTKIIIKFK